MTKKWLLSLALAGSVSLLTACGGGAGGEANGPASEQKSDSSASQGPSSQMQKPDLKDIPDVVATVNGTKIPKQEFVAAYEGQFQQAALQAQMTGQKPDAQKLKDQTAQALVGTELLIQEADKRDIEAKPKAIDAALSELVETSGLKSQEKFMSTAKKQGMDKAEVMDQIKTKVKVEQLVAGEAGDTEPTEQEIKAAYKMAKAQQQQMGEKSGKDSKMPALEDVKPQLKEQLASQKEAQATQSLISELRKSADVKINL